MLYRFYRNPDILHTLRRQYFLTYKTKFSPITLLWWEIEYQNRLLESWFLQIKSSIIIKHNTVCVLSTCLKSCIESIVSVFRFTQQISIKPRLLRVDTLGYIFLSPFSVTFYGYLFLSPASVTFFCHLLWPVTFFCHLLR